jgi:hypothetical protein
MHAYLELQVPALSALTPFHKQMKGTTGTQITQNLLLQKRHTIRYTDLFLQEVSNLLTSTCPDISFI